MRCALRAAPLGCVPSISLRHSFFRKRGGAKVIGCCPQRGNDPPPPARASIRCYMRGLLANVYVGCL